ncbi:uncharacterized protein LOC125869909 [Solanum stenotomum]|uniref:uncharacterized protein LOC125869909 n=1 Tax=Solanum stenotomum TaxID=172797 RepID=UPI0020D13D99|nr:uncharacterized protein LOC125869909 [Solanum stenotomum]
MMQKMIKRFDVINENVKETQNDLSSIGQKVDAHAVSIKHFELQMTQLSTIVKPRQPGTLPSNTIQKKDGYCMTVTTRGGKQTIDPPMPSRVEVKVSKDDEVIEVNGEPENATEKEVEITQKVIPMPRPPPFFPQRLVKETEEGKYRKFISMLKQLSINVSLIEVLEQMPGSLVQKKENLGAFTIPCTIGLLHFAMALCDLGASINLMPLAIYRKLGLGDPKSTAM